jgi:hypothetical protein
MTSNCPSIFKVLNDEKGSFRDLLEHSFSPEEKTWVCQIIRDDTNNSHHLTLEEAIGRYNIMRSDIIEWLSIFDKNLDFVVEESPVDDIGAEALYQWLLRNNITNPDIDVNNQIFATSSGGDEWKKEFTAFFEEKVTETATRRAIRKANIQAIRQEQGTTTSASSTFLLSKEKNFPYC